jgi:hypothetical protein
MSQFEASSLPLADLKKTGDLMLMNLNQLASRSVIL